MQLRESGVLRADFGGSNRESKEVIENTNLCTHGGTGKASGEDSENIASEGAEDTDFAALLGI